jgi:hypothetical protein
MRIYFKKIFLFLFLLGIQLNSAFSQQEKPIEEPKPNFDFALRGKVIGFFIIEDNYFLTGTIGGQKSP